MILDRVFTPGLAQVAYLIADEEAGVAAVIDPRRDINAYLDWAKSHNLRIVAALETHVHADFVSGARELAEATGATIFASRLGNQEFPHKPLDDGDMIAIGELTLQALWTPGHTPEHMSFLLTNPEQRPGPIALYSGDLLFVGEVGRPDLLGSDQTQILAKQLYETFAQRLADLPDDLIVFPGHTAGSSCGKSIGDAPQTTLGQERLFNYAMQPDVMASQDAFIAAVMTGMPTPPAYYPTMKRVNKVGPTLVKDLTSGAALSVDEVVRQVAEGALIIDVRSIEAFNKAHIINTFFAGPDDDLVNWTGWLAPYDRQLILVLDDESRFESVRTALRRIGLDRVTGYLAGGIAAWQQGNHAIDSTPTITVDMLRDRMSKNDGLVVLDVRSRDEWNRGHIAGAVTRFAGEIAKGAGIPVESAPDIAIICASGYRSTVSISLLESRGHHNLINVSGGMDAWQAARLPLEVA